MCLKYCFLTIAYCWNNNRLLSKATIRMHLNLGGLRESHPRSKFKAATKYLSYQTFYNDIIGHMIMAGKYVVRTGLYRFERSQQGQKGNYVAILKWPVGIWPFWTSVRSRAHPMSAHAPSLALFFICLFIFLTLCSMT